jgi:hypothetical protein
MLSKGLLFYFERFSPASVCTLYMNSKGAKRFPRSCLRCLLCAANKSSCHRDDELVLPAPKPFHHSLTKTHPGVVRMITVYFFLSLPLFGEHEEAISKGNSTPRVSGVMIFFSA